MRTMLSLSVGSKSYSSWSLRPWLLMKHLRIDFMENVIPFVTVPGTRQMSDETRGALKSTSPSGLVPVLETGTFKIWDSLAICEFLAESFPDLRLWPTDVRARAQARAVSSEMHSSFSNLRGYLPFCCKQQTAMSVNGDLPEPALADIARVEQIWEECRSMFGQGSPFLFGEFSIADAMYAPVAVRFHTYRVDVRPEAQRYVETMLRLDALTSWILAAKAEKETIEPIDRLVRDFRENVSTIRTTEKAGSTEH